MSTEHTFDPYGDTRQREKRPRSWFTTCLFGCLIMFVIGVVLAAALLYWLSQNWRGWASDLGTQVLKQSIEESDLPEQEKQEVQAQVERVFDALRDGTLSGEQFGRIVEKVAESPLLPSIIASTAETKYLEPSGLSEDEKAEARVTIHRFVRGATDGDIDEASVNEAMAHIADRAGDGWQLRENVTDDELRAFLATAKAQADDAGVPEEPEEFDPSDEVKRIIDEAMGEQLAEEPIDAEKPMDAEAPTNAETPTDAEESTDSEARRE
jgi:hypothetical protein